MPSQPNAILGASGALQVLRRLTFAPKPADVDKFSTMTRQDAADELVDYKPSHFRPNNRDIRVSFGRWFKYMLRTRLQLQEKLVLFWHDHFATGNDKVLYPQSMSLQNRTLRSFSNGNFKAFVKAINIDPAMIEYLDTQRNRKAIPNENYARELQELFTLGVLDLNGKKNYAQADIVQIARAFTGHRYDYNKLTHYFNGAFSGGQHDYMVKYPSRGPKVIYGTPRDDAPGNIGGFAGPQSFAPTAAVDSNNLNSEGEFEIDAVIDVIFQHTDTDGESTVARFITKKLLSYFCYPDPSKALIDEVIGDSDFATDAHPNQWEIKPLLKAMIVNDAFYETQSMPYATATKKSIKWPVDFAVSTMRLLNLKPTTKYPYIVDEDFGYLYDQLGNMGQYLFDPPSVFGWDWETSWISSTTLLARCGFATDVIGARSASGRLIFQPENLIDITETDAGTIVDAVLVSLGLSDGTNSAFTSTERDALIDYLTDGVPANPVNLADFDIRNTKLHGLYGLLLQSAHYQLQ